MEYFGIIELCGVRGGFRKNGEEWKTHGFKIVPPNGRGNRGMFFEVMDDRWKALTDKGLRTGALGKVHFDVSIHEWNERWINDFFVISFEPYKAAAAKEEETAPTAPPAEGEKEEEGELPF